MKRLLTILGLIAAFFALEVAVCSGQSRPATDSVLNAATCSASDVQLKYCGINVGYAIGFLLLRVRSIYA